MNLLYVVYKRENKRINIIILRLRHGIEFLRRTFESRMNGRIRYIDHGGIAVFHATMGLRWTISSVGPSLMKWRHFRTLLVPSLNQSRCGWAPTSEGNSVMRCLAGIHRDMQDRTGSWDSDGIRWFSFVASSWSYSGCL